MKKIVLSFTIIALLAACADEQPSAESTDEPTTVPSHEAHKQAEWLLGRWENNSDQGNLSEIWEKKNDSLYIGTSYFEINRDTVFNESVELIEKDGVLNYIVSIPKSNQGAVPFKLTKSSETEMVFENPKHNFPQTITYTHKGDSLIAIISGKEKGKPKKEVFAMKKTN